MNESKIQYECERICKVLENNKAEWGDRCQALENLKNICNDGGAVFPCFLEFLIRLKEPIATQLKDLRSSIVKEACLMVSNISNAFHELNCKPPSGLLMILCAFVEPCLKQVPVTIKIISESAENCLKSIVSNLAPYGSSKLLSMLITATDDKNSHIRYISTDLLGIALSQWQLFWRAGSSGKFLGELTNRIKKLIIDSDSQTRLIARRTFWSYHNCAPEAADKLLKKLDSSNQRRILETKPSIKPSSPSSSKTSKSSIPASEQDGKVENIEETQQQQNFHKSVQPKSEDDLNYVALNHGRKEDKAISEKSRALRIANDEKPSINNKNNSIQNSEYNALDYGKNKISATRVVANRVIQQQQQQQKRQLGRGALRVQSNAVTVPGGGVSISAMAVSSSDISTKSKNQIEEISKTQRATTSPVSISPTHKEVENNFNCLINDLELSHQWSTRMEAMQSIMNKYTNHNNTLPNSCIEKLTKTMCERAGDQHYRVSIEVIKGIYCLLPQYQKEFGANLKIMLPALFNNLGNSRTSIKDNCNKVLNLCIKFYSPDTLCLICSNILRKKGDTLRLGSIEYLIKIIPLSNTYFTHLLHMTQIIKRIEPCLSSRKLDLRQNSEKIILTLYQFDQDRFSLVLNLEENVDLKHKILKITNQFNQNLSKTKKKRNSFLK